MKVILQEKIANLGNIGDQVIVKSGYARNYLLPYEKAVPATPFYLAEFEKRREEFRARAEENFLKAQERAKALTAVEAFTIVVQATEEGKLFGSVGAREIAEAIQGYGIELEKREINLPQGVLRQTGEYIIRIQLHSDVESSIKINIQPEKSA